MLQDLLESKSRLFLTIRHYFTIEKSTEESEVWYIFQILLGIVQTKAPLWASGHKAESVKAKKGLSLYALQRCFYIRRWDVSVWPQVYAMQISYLFSFPLFLDTHHVWVW